jgi:predicted nucleotidyltransferase
MERDRVLEILRNHAPELQRSGVLHLHVFGSVARGESTPDSDVDVFAEFAPEIRMTLVKLGNVEEQLRDILGRPVELTAAEWMRQPIRERAVQEAVIAF